MTAEHSVDKLGEAVFHEEQANEPGLPCQESTMQKIGSTPKLLCLSTGNL